MTKGFAVFSIQKEVSNRQLASIQQQVSSLKEQLVRI
jgi:hypothetical protein